MKFVLLTVVLLGMVFCVSGCISSENQIRLNQLTADQKDEVEKLVAERLAAYILVETQMKDVKAKIETGSISLDDGRKYIELLRSELAATVEKVEKQIKDTKEAYKAEQERIIDSGASKAEYYLGIGVSILASFFGVNAYRSRKHPLTKEIT